MVPFNNAVCSKKEELILVHLKHSTVIAYALDYRAVKVNSLVYHAYEGKLPSKFPDIHGPTEPWLPFILFERKNI